MPAAEVAVNMTRWNALSPDLKVFMEMAVRDFAREMVQRIALEDLKAVEQAPAQNIELVSWTADERKRFRQVAQQAWADWAKKSPTAQKVYDSQVAFLRKLRLLD